LNRRDFHVSLVSVCVGLLAPRLFESPRAINSPETTAFYRNAIVVDSLCSPSRSGERAGPRAVCRDIRKTAVVVKDGIVYRPQELYAAVGVAP
jgi:hypothetical protein